MDRQPSGVFRHERLTLGGNSIRLITICPDHDDAPIACEITQYASHRRPGYVALSYTWGGEANQFTILLNGEIFYVRRNLYDCLRRLRQFGQHEVYFWIDALCIDQTNVEERNHIVQLMDQVYDRADEVYVWLGEGDENSDRAMRFLTQIVKTAPSSTNLTDWFLEQYMMTADHYQDWVCVVRLFKRAYWTRLWVAQETLLAPSIKVLCGVHLIPWNWLQQMVLLVRSSFDWYRKRRPEQAFLHNAILETVAARMVLRRCDSAQFSGKRSSYPSLQALLETFKDSECFDPRDGIFGLLSIASDFYDKRIDYLDYNLRPTQIFVNFLKNYVGKNRNPDDDEALFNVRRLSDALRIDVWQILRHKNKNSESKQAYEDLLCDNSDLTLAFPCQILFTLADEGNLIEDPGSHCVLRDSIKPSLSRRSSRSDGPLPPASPIGDADDEASNMKSLVRSRGYQVCDAYCGATDIEIPKGELRVDYSNYGTFKYFTRATDLDGSNFHFEPTYGIGCPSACSGDILVHTAESELTFVARYHQQDGVYDIIGTAALHEKHGGFAKRLHIPKIWHHHHHHHHHHQRTTSAASSNADHELPEVRFNPLMLAMIVNEPSWRKDRISLPQKGVDRQPTSYKAIQPRGEDDPVMKYYGTKEYTGSTHIDRAANRLWDRTANYLEEIREYKNDWKEWLSP